jgi:hypothetical protein
MAEALLTALPEPEQLTLLFKNGKQTVLLSVDPSRLFSEIKALLLAALKSRNIVSIRNVADGPRVPISKPEDIEFGVLVDRKDATKGWVPLYIGEQEVLDSRAGKKKARGKTNTSNQSPEGAGLTDGSWIAFRVKVASQKEVRDDDEGDEDDMETDEDPGWNVALPTFEIEGE